MVTGRTWRGQLGVVGRNFSFANSLDSFVWRECLRMHPDLEFARYILCGLEHRLEFVWVRITCLLLASVLQWTLVRAPCMVQAFANGYWLQKAIGYML